LKINSSNGSTSNSETDYLAELILDFPPLSPVSTDKAFELLRTRYEQLEKNIGQFLSLLKSSTPSKSLFPFQRLFIEEDRFPAHFYIFCRKFHLFLFKDILNNAGQFRQSSDPKSGIIGYGGFHRRMVGNFRYTGSSPSNIVDELCLAFLLLRNNSKNPVVDALEFYRRFVKIHPFYDANGRIARLILGIYLVHYNFYINWRGIETGGNKTKFIKRLNNCHDRQNQYNYNEYFGYLFDHFNSFVINVDQLDKD